MPKFTIEFGTPLNQTLSQLGLECLFQRNQFSNLTEPGDLYIDFIIHKTFLEVNEKGAEAAAVTAVTMRAAAKLHIMEEFHMTVDSPFVFVIREVETGIVLFIGVINNVQKE